MNVVEAYDNWSGQYDTNENKTRDLEGISIRAALRCRKFHNCLEIGCGTGKNTEFLLSCSDSLVAVDLSDAMLAKAKQKNSSERVRFVRADINEEWKFTKGSMFDLATFSLVLEHIEDLNPIFNKLSSVMNIGATVYIGELHPFKQYSGTKARFEDANGLHVVQCYNHNISDFTNAAAKNGFRIADLQEHFDDDNRSGIPRILSLLLEKIS